MERQQQGEQMRLLIPASLPDSPSFPNRLMFAARRPRVPDWLIGLGARTVAGIERQIDPQ